jgi:hypothetical protein
MSDKEFELAGLTDDEGNLGRPVPHGHVFVPGTIELDGDTLRWEYTRNSKFVEISPSTLNEFVRLWSEDPPGILKFARKWGVLAMERLGGKDPVFYRPCGEGMSSGADPLVAWPYFSRRASAVLNIAAALHQGRLGDLGDWATIAADCSHDPSLGLQHPFGLGFNAFDRARNFRFGINDLEEARGVIAREIQTWLSSWRARRQVGVSDFALIWNPHASQWELRIDYHGYLFAALALQLALCIAGADSLFTCSGCGVPYVREAKRPKPGTANYCSKCSQKGVAQRRAVDAYRERKAEAVKLQAGGTPLSEIALKLNTSISRVRKWCSTDNQQPTHRRATGSVRSKKARGRAQR